MTNALKSIPSGGLIAQLQRLVPVAGLFQTHAGIPAVVRGPGDNAQAHKPNEFTTLEQIAKGEDFMQRLMEEVCAG